MTARCEDHDHLVGDGQCRVVSPRSKWSTEFHQEAAALMHMALAEAGYPVETEWDDEDRTFYVRSSKPPWAVMNRARILVCDRLGVQWWWECDWPIEKEEAA